MLHLTFGFTPRKKLTIAEAIRRIKKHGIIEPCPSSSTFRRLCEDGTLETVGGKPTPLGWLIYEESFNAWLRGMDAVDF